MQHLSYDVIMQLLTGATTGPAVTMYAPMHIAATPPHMRGDQIRFRNLINKAITRLRRRTDGAQLAAHLQNVRDTTLADQLFWESQTQGLLLCARGNETHMFRLPVDTEEYIAVDHTLHLAPVLGLVQAPHEFYVLALAQHDPQLLQGDLYDLYETDIHLPDSLEAALRIDEKNQKRVQPLSAAGQGKIGFNGRGGGRDRRLEERAKFFRLIDRAILRRADRSLPLILAGTEADMAEYRAVSKRQNIVPGGIAGNFADAHPHELFGLAHDILQQKVVRPHQQAAQAEAATDSDLRTLQEAAQNGRIATFFVGMYRTTADTVRDTLRPVTRITFFDETRSRLLHRLAVMVARAGGRVYNLDARDMPGGVPAAAAFRY